MGVLVYTLSLLYANQTSQCLIKSRPLCVAALLMHRCLDALVTMGVLVPTGDKLAVRRTAQFFLNSFQVRRGGSFV
jgi:hypothetical protein